MAKLFLAAALAGGLNWPTAKQVSPFISLKKQLSIHELQRDLFLHATLFHICLVKSWFYFWLFYRWLCHVRHHLPPLLRQPLEDPECWLYQRDQPMRLPAMTEIRCIRTVPSSLVIVGLSNWRQACYAGSVENTISCHETTPLSLSKCPIKSNSNLKLLHKCPTE